MNALLCMPVLQLLFQRGPHGKPHLIPESAGAAAADVASQLQFNLSHTEALLGEYDSVTCYITQCVSNASLHCVQMAGCC
jgi:hypothetical protein